MFEAHTLNAFDADLENVGPEKLDLENSDKENNIHQTGPQRFHRRHTASLRPLSIWWVEGKRKDHNQIPQPCWFIYAEFRDDKGQRSYRTLEIPQRGQSSDQLIQLACNAHIAALEADK